MRDTQRTAYSTFHDFARALADKCSEWYLGLGGGGSAPEFTYLDKNGIGERAEDDHQIEKAVLAELYFHAPFCVWVRLQRIVTLPNGVVGWWHDPFHVAFITNWKTDPDALEKVHEEIRRRVLSHDPSCVGEYRKQFCAKCVGYGVRGKTVKKGTKLWSG